MRWVISGTGTGIGKTWVGCAVARHALGAGVGCIALKPVESGGDEDARALATACMFHVQPSPYTFREAVSPHLAARRAGVRIDLESCRSWVQCQAQGAAHTLVELAGGLLTPLAPGITNLDLLQKMRPDGWVAVAPDRLGVLHELHALLLCARERQLSDPLVVLSESTESDLSTGTNACELAALGICVVTATFVRAPPQAPATRDAAGRLAHAMRIV